MGFKALVTLDLPNINEEQREQFYDILKEGKWKKIKNLTTAWKISFIDGGTRDGAIRILENQIKKAKNECKVSTVEYAIQLDTDEIIINTL